LKHFVERGEARAQLEWVCKGFKRRKRMVFGRD